MIFSAVALVAFSFAGMANEVKDENKIDSKEEILFYFKKELTIMPENCEDCYQYADGLDDGNDPRMVKWRHNMNTCYTSNGCDAPFPGF
jgi:hypothetical protein